MDDVGRVHEQETPQDLVNEVLDVVVTEFLSGVDHPMQVGLHQISDDIDVIVIGPCLRF